jgi:hypothetical protein
LSGADPTVPVTIDGQELLIPSDETSGGLAGYSGWNPVPNMTSGAVINLPSQYLDGNSHSIMFKIAATAKDGCVNPQTGAGPWVIGSGSSQAGGWVVAEPLAITGAPTLWASLQPLVSTTTPPGILSTWAALSYASGQGDTVSGCAPTPINTPPGTTFHYTAWNFSTGGPSAGLDTPISLADGQTASFLVDFLTTQGFGSTWAGKDDTAYFNFACSGVPPALNNKDIDGWEVTAAPSEPYLVFVLIPANPNASQDTPGGTLQFQAGTSLSSLPVKSAIAGSFVDVAFDTNSVVTLTPVFDGAVFSNLPNFNAPQICQTSGGQCVGNPASSLQLTVSHGGIFTFNVILTGPPCWPAGIAADNTDRLTVNTTFTNSNNQVVEVGKGSIAVAPAGFCGGQANAVVSSAH